MEDSIFHYIHELNMIYDESKVILVLMVMLRLFKGVITYLCLSGHSPKLIRIPCNQKCLHQDLITRLLVMIYSGNIFQLFSQRSSLKFTTRPCYRYFRRFSCEISFDQPSPYSDPQKLQFSEEIDFDTYQCHDI